MYFACSLTTIFGLYAEGYQKECILSVRGYAEICTTSVAFGAAYTLWNRCQRRRSLKPSRSLTHAWMFYHAVVVADEDTDN